MEVYLGRQPILDRALNVAGYELFFRSGEANLCDLTDHASATSQVIVNAVLGTDLDKLLGGKSAFINFDRTLLLGDWSTVLPPERTVIEILKSVPADSEILSACHALQQQGYALALDGCADDVRTDAFASFVDILKVDFQNTSRADQEKLMRRYQKISLKMVAAKVETQQEFQRAKDLGYHYFQGYFFDHPTVVQASRIPPAQLNGLRLVKQIQREELDYHAIESLIRHDVSFSHSLLKYLNSAAFHWADRVESIRRALLLLGSTEIRKWAWMASLTNMGESRPPALIQQVLTRGRFCEEISRSASLPLGDSDPFLLGMFSLLDAILQRPLPGLLEDLSIGQKIRNALLGTAGSDDPLALILRIVISYEAGDWETVDAASRAIGLSAQALRTCYLDSVFWVDAVYSFEQLAATVGQPIAAVDFRRAKEAGFCV